MQCSWGWNASDDQPLVTSLATRLYKILIHKCQKCYKIHSEIPQKIKSNVMFNLKRAWKWSLKQFNGKLMTEVFSQSKRFGLISDKCVIIRTLVNGNGLLCMETTTVTHPIWQKLFTLLHKWFSISCLYVWAKDFSCLFSQFGLEFLLLNKGKQLKVLSTI